MSAVVRTPLSSYLRGRGAVDGGRKEERVEELRHAKGEI